MIGGLVALTVLSPLALPQVTFVVEGRGSFTMEVRIDQAPKIGGHFLDLVDRKFYDRILFHRLVPGFVVQSGDPESKKVTPAWARNHPGESGGTENLGEGGSGKSVPFEINDLKHTKYSVGMALESPMDDSGDSQFFINLADNHRLDGSYVVFARVTKGKGVVDKIRRGDRIKTAHRSG
ncbi:MAG: peptidylprolyl isomerase [Fimbriimonadaceae bacterium]|nr:peptidylprolyl isomerase [Fimbriimonadaceae bacterium]QYK54737.1 MAG: peptidylprolyl isomerase [Fimbriimonadaceae bacterium]